MCSLRFSWIGRERMTRTNYFQPIANMIVSAKKVSNSRFENHKSECAIIIALLDRLRQWNPVAAAEHRMNTSQQSVTRFNDKEHTDVRGISQSHIHTLTHS